MQMTVPKNNFPLTVPLPLKMHDRRILLQFQAIVCKKMLILKKKAFKGYLTIKSINTTNLCSSYELCVGHAKALSP